MVGKIRLQDTPEETYKGRVTVTGLLPRSAPLVRTVKIL